MKKEHGFTFVELMTTLVIASVLLTVGVPSMRDLVRNNRLIATTNTFVSTLNIARSEAIKQGRTAQLCVSSDQATCTAQTNWQLGWLAWVDLDGDGVLDNPVETIRIVEPLPNAVTLTLSTVQTSISVDSQGAVATPNLTLTVCDNRTGETGRRLRILATGSVSLNSQFVCP